MSPGQSYLAAGLASALFVAVKAFQQQNVTHHKWAWVMPTSLMMAATEVYVVANVVKYGYHLALVLCVGVGAGLGCIVGMLAHLWLHPRR